MNKLLATLVSLALFIGQAPLYALPQGAEVTHGSAHFQQALGKLTIENSHRAVINWQDFSIGAGEITEFIQSGANSAVLNKVIGDNVSQIYGTLRSNGSVYLINPNGILVGQSGVIDVHSFVASTLDLDAAAFARGDTLLFHGTSDAGIENLGLIQATGGDVVLLARTVKNSGSIHATDGRIDMAGGKRFELKTRDDHLFSVIVPEETTDAAGGSVDNAGVLEAAQVELKARGGNPYALAVNNTGSIRATGFVKKDGQILLVAQTGTVRNTGDLQAEGQDSSITLLGNHVTLEGDARIDVSSEEIAGSITIGGGFRGQGTEQTADTVYVGEHVQLRADSGNGNGGEIAVWAEDTMEFHGQLSAQALGSLGDGGLAEVSGKNILIYDGVAHLSAANGATGTLTLDPNNIHITSGAADAGYSRITPATILANLVGANVTVDTTGADGEAGIIKISEAINGAGGNHLYIYAHNDIQLNADIVLASGNLTLIAGWDGGTAATAGNGNLDLSTGNRNLQVGGGTVTVWGGLNYGGNTLDLNATNVTLFSDAIDFALTNFNSGTNLHIAPTASNSAINLGGATANLDIPQATGNNFTNFIIGQTGASHAITVDNGSSWDPNTNITLNSGTLSLLNDLKINGGSSDLTINNSGALTTDDANNEIRTATLTFGGAGNVGTSGTPIRTTATTIAFNNSSGNIFINEDDNLALQGTHTGNFNLLTGNWTGTGNITQGASALNISGTLTLTADNDASDDITLTNTSNSFGDLNIQAENVNLGSSANLTDGTAGIIANTVTINASGRSVTFDDNNTDVNTYTFTAASDVTLVDTDDIDLAASTLSGNLSITSGGIITDSGAWNISGTTTLNTTNFAGNGDVTITESGAFNFGASIIGGDLAITAGNVGDNGGVQVAGSITTGAGTSINFDAGGGQFTEFTDASGNINIARVGAIDIGARNVNGNLNVTSSSSAVDFNGVEINGNAIVLDQGGHNFGGDLSITTAYNNNGTLNGVAQITQSGDIVVTGTTRLTAQSNGAITVTRAGNNFNQLNLDGGTTQVVDLNAISIGTTDINGNLTLTTNGNITDAGTINVSGITTLNSGGNDIIWDTAHRLNQIAISNTANATINDQNNLVIAAAGISTTTSVSMDFNGTLTDTGSIQTGTLTLDANSGAGDDITLDNAANDVDKLIVTAVEDIVFVDADALELGAMSVAGAMNISTGGAITNTGNITAGESSTQTFAAGAGNDITLGSAGNDFGTVVITSGKDVTIVDTDTLALGASTISGTLQVTTNGNLTDTGNITVAGATATFNVTNNDNITLDSAGNDFNTVVITAANNVEIRDTDAIDFGASTISGNWTVTSGGLISDSGALSIGGNIVLNTTNDPANNAGNVTLVSDSGWNFTAITVGGNLSLDAGGNQITDSGALSVAGNVTTVGTTSVYFDEFGSTINDFTDGAGKRTILKVGAIDIAPATQTNGLVVVSSKNGVSFNSAYTGNDAIVLNNANSFSGNVTITTDADSSAATANSGITQSGALTVGTQAIFKAEGADANALTGNITLDNVNNDFTTQVQLIGDNVTLRDANNLALAASTISGNFAPTALGGTLTDHGTLVVTGTTTLNADAGSITLDSAANDFQGNVLITGDNDVSLVDTNAFTFGTSNLSANLTLTAGGNITQSDQVVVTGTSDLTSTGGAITLTDADNNFGTVNLSATTDGTDISLRDTNGLIIADIDTDNSDTDDLVTLQVDAGTVTQTGAITVEQLLLIGTSTDFTLANAGNSVRVLAANTQSLNLYSDRQLNLETLGATNGVTTNGGNLNLDINNANTLYTDHSIATNGGNLTLNDTLYLNADVTLNTNGGALDTQAITTAAGAGRKGLTIETATGNVRLRGNVGTTGTELTQIAINNAGTITAEGTLAAHASGITLNGTSMTLQGAVSTNTGNITLNNSGALALQSTVSSGGFFKQTGAGSVSTSNNITTTNAELSLNSALTLAGNAALNTGAGAGDIIFKETVNGNAKLTLTAGTGNIDFQKAVGNTTALSGIEIVSANNLDFDASVAVDDEGLTVTSASTIDLASTVTSTNGGALSLTHSGTMTMAGNLSLDGAFTQAGGGAVQTAGSITTTNDAILFDNGEITLTADVALNSNGGNVRFDNNVRGNFKLTIAAGSGDIDFQSTVGSGTALSGLLISSAANLDFENTVAVDDEGIDITAGTVDIKNTFTTTNSGGIEITNSGLLTVDAGATITADGGFAQNGSSNTTLGANVITTNDAIAFGSGTLTIGADRTFNTGAGAGNITLSGTVTAGANNLTFSAGTGAITATAATNTMGTVTATGSTVQITDSAAMNFANVNATHLTATAGGAITQNAGTEINVTGTAVFDTTSYAAGGDVTFVSDAAALTLGDTSVGGDMSITAPSTTTSGTIQVAGQATINGSSVALSSGASLTLDASGNLTAVGAGVIDINIANVPGNLTVTSKESGVVFGSVNNGDAVKINNANNTFGGTVRFQTASNKSTVTNQVTGIRQSVGLTVAGETQLTAEYSGNFANTADIILNNAANDFQGVVNISSRNATVHDTNTLELGTVNTRSDTLTLTTGGALTQSGVLTAGKLALTAGGTVTLTQDNAISSLGLSAAGQTVNITNTTDMNIGTVGAVSGLTAGTATLTQKSGTLSLDSGSTLQTTAGGLTISSDAVNLAGTVNAALQTVELSGYTAGKALTLGSTTGTATHKLSNNISAATFNLGKNTTGNLTVTEALSLGSAAVNLKSGGDIALNETISTTGGLTLLGTGANHTFNIQKTIAGTPLTISGGAGDETIIVGSANALTDLKALLTINGGAGNDTLKLDSSLATSAQSYTLNANTLTQTGSAGVAFSNLSNFNFQGGAANENLLINNPTLNITATGGAGNDVFTTEFYSVTQSFDGEDGNDSLLIASLNNKIPVNTPTLTSTGKGSIQVANVENLLYPAFTSEEENSIQSQAIGGLAQNTDSKPTQVDLTTTTEEDDDLSGNSVYDKLSDLYSYRKGNRNLQDFERFSLSSASSFSLQDFTLDLETTAPALASLR